MSLIGVRALLVALSLLALAVGVAGTALSVSGGTPPPPASLLVRHTEVHTGPVDSLVRLMVVRAPFRLTRTLATAAYDPDRRAVPMSSSSPTTPMPVRPTLVLSGVVWGRDPTAVIEGFPSVDGPRVVHRGDVVDDLKIRRIEPTGVVIVGRDTTWHLTMRTSWP